MTNKLTGKTSIQIKAEPDKVWDALTNPAKIKQYFFGTDAVSDWKEGSSLVFKGEWQGKSYEDKGKILKIVPNKVLIYNYWSSMSGIEDKPENYANITYELDKKEGMTSLTVTQDNIPNEQMKEHSQQNWKQFL
jgi:uncharacterized protein YndB with AHSA1/START domain